MNPKSICRLFYIIGITHQVAKDNKSLDKLIKMRKHKKESIKEK